MTRAWSIAFIACLSAASRADEAPVGDAWSDARNPIVQLFKGERLDVWSLKPVAEVAPPSFENDAWSRTEVDRFVLAWLRAEGLEPSAAADRRTLARRLAFDLTGLPPTPEEVDAFVRDDSPDAVEKWVDRLLASPRFGEHWGRMWLDVIRYSDSNGYDWDEFRPQAWRFRDYVIRAYNADVPFDRFVTEQLAGDELLDGPPRDDAEQAALVATGYLRVGPQDNSAKLFNEDARARHEWLTDLTETTCSAFLALTVSCCRCHDHKTEPMSQADHYRFRAFFEGVSMADDTPLDLADAQEAIRRHNAAVEAEKKPLEEDKKALLATVKKRLGKKASDKEVRKALTAEEKKRQAELDAKLGEIAAREQKFTPGLCATDAKDPPAATRVLAAGDYRSAGEEVAPAFLTILNPQAATLRQPRNPATTGRRLTLAQWIASADNPLTARVYVNRVWQMLFGAGLVASPNDFGLSGARPTHPELLDWLARTFVADGWSTKKLVRRIVASAVYRQSSLVRPDAATVDVGNALLWRQNARRLSAEQLRDALLATSGTLLPKADGPPVWPELPEEVLKANPAFLDDNETKTKGWYPSPEAERGVRGVFLVQKRTVRVPFMETFDLPENATSCARRTVSTVAPQALTLLNGSDATLAAKALAARVAREAATDSPEARIDRGWQLVLQRLPDATERARASSFLQERTLDELCRVLLNLNEFITVE